MERPDQETIDSFVSITGASESIAVQKLQERGGDLNNALDAYFAEFGDNNVPVTHVSAPRRDSRQLADADDYFRSDFPLMPASGILDRFLGSNNLRSLFREPTFFPSQANDERNFDSRSIFGRHSLFPEQEPFVSHPREVREIPIEVKDSNGPDGSSSSPMHVPTIVDVTDTEHDHGPGISGFVTMDDDDFAFENDMPSQTTQVDHVSDNDIAARPARTDYLDDDDIEEQMILAAIEASQHEAEENQSASSFVTPMELDEVEDAEERPLVRQKTKSLSSSLKELPKENAERAPGNNSSTTHHDQNTVFPYMPHEEELDIQQASLPQEPLPDENDAVNILIRMSDGGRLSRRFLKSDKLKVVFDFLQICGGVHPGGYKLVMSYPRRTFSDADGSLTLEEVGITSKHQALYLESV